MKSSNIVYGTNYNINIIIDIWYLSIQKNVWSHDIIHVIVHADYAYE